MKRVSAHEIRVSVNFNFAFSGIQTYVNEKKTYKPYVYGYRTLKGEIYWHLQCCVQSHSSTQHSSVLPRRDVKCPAATANQH